jgi:hypothetical protein
VDEPDTVVNSLVKISTEPGNIGEVTVVCADLTLPPGLPADATFTSLTFNGQQLYGSARQTANGDTLVHIDPCTCIVSEVGQYGFTLVNGITSNEAQTMFGSSAASDEVISIDPSDASSIVVSSLPSDWGSHGLTWSDPVDNLLYGINATDDRLYTFDGTSTLSQGSIALSVDFGSVGIEYHPGDDILWACGVAGDQRSLYSVNINTGIAALEATDILGGICDNLAAPFGPVDCIPE